MNLKRYGPRLGAFALLLAAVAALLALRVHFKNRQSTDIGARLDAILDMPDPAARVEPLRTLLRENSGAEAEPWILLCLGNQLFQKAEGLPAAEATPLNQEAGLHYREICDRWPEHPAAPLALFSAGCCAEQLGQEVEARRLYADLQERYATTFLAGGGGSKDESFLARHSSGMAERVRAFHEAFPNGLKPPPPATPPAPPAPAAPKP